MKRMQIRLPDRLYAQAQRIARKQGISLAEDVPDLIAIYQFGSAGTAAMRAESDVDLAFLAGRAADPVATWDLAQTLARTLGRDVDLIDLRRASTVMRAQIVSTGTRMLCHDAARCDAFEAYVLSDYARLNEERRGILDDVRARGRIHA